MSQFSDDAETLDAEDDELWVYSGTLTEDNRPHVLWRYKGQDGMLSVTEARTRAQQLFTAAAIAEAEAAIFIGISGVLAPKDKVPGFGFKAQAAEAANKASMQEMAARLTLLIRGHRPALPEGLEIIYGMKSKAPLLVLHWYDEKMQMLMELQSVRDHALRLLEAAESAEADAFFLHFLANKCQIEPLEAFSMLRGFLAFRQQTGLEDLFHSTPDTAPKDDR